MKTFKEILQEDIKNVFFNVDEMAEECLWNGKPVKAVIDDDSMIAKYSSEFEFLAEGSHMVMLPADGMPEAPKVASVVNFDGNLYEIHQIDVQCGVYLIFLNRRKT